VDFPQVLQGSQAIRGFTMIRITQFIFTVTVCVALMSATQAAGFIPLGHLPDGSSGASIANGVSADGSVVVGESSAMGFSEAFRWTASSGMVGLGDLAGGFTESKAFGVSSDGTVVIGTSSSASGDEAFRWTSSGGMVGLGDLGGPIFGSRGSGISADGSVVVGDAFSPSGTEAFRWTSSGGMVGLGGLPGSIGVGTEAWGVSANGSVVVGLGNSATGGTEAFRWTSGGGMVGLGDLPGGLFRSTARGVSADGGVVVGDSSSAASGDFFTEAFRWTSGGGMVGLGDLPGGPFRSLALGVSADGNVVVGWSMIALMGSEAFVWTQANGMERLIDVLMANGATGLTGWTLESAQAISANGQWVVGFGTNPVGASEAFLANITPVPIPAAVWLFGSALGFLSWTRRNSK